MKKNLSCDRCAFCTISTFYLVNFVNLLYPDGAMKNTAKCNMLNEIRKKQILATIFNGES